MAETGVRIQDRPPPRVQLGATVGGGEHISQGNPALFLSDAPHEVPPCLLACSEKFTGKKSEQLVRLAAETSKRIEYTYR